MHVSSRNPPGKRACAAFVAGWLSFAPLCWAQSDFDGSPFAPVDSPGFTSLRQGSPLGTESSGLGAHGPENVASEPPGEAAAAPGNGSLEDLAARIEALERQNAELMERLGSMEAAPTTNPPMGEDPTGSPRGVEAESSGLGGDGPGAAPSSSAARTNPKTTEAGTAKVADGDGWYEVGSDLGMTGSWNNGLEFISKNKDFRVHIGGRVQFDTIWWDNADAFTGTGPPGDEDAFDFRRARFRIDGTMYEWIDFATEMDFANTINANLGQQPASNNNVVGSPAITELWLNFKGVPYVGNVRVGNMKNPIGMEHLTSSRFLPFLERSFNQDVFYGPFNNGFIPGGMIWNQYANQRGLWATGIFRETKNPFAYGVDDGSYSWTSRITYLLWYDECSNGRSLFHVGLSNKLVDPITGVERYRARPSLRNGPPIALNPVFADTGAFAVETADYVGTEAAWNYGPFNLQAEYTPGFLHGATGNRGAFNNVPIGDEFIQGGYVQALYFLTGEHMMYDRTTGSFARVIPNENAYVLKGLRENVFTRGAWQVGFRYSYLDLDSSDALDGGILNDYTWGLNWYFNPNAKLQWNYVLTHRDVPTALGEGGFASGFGMRLAWDF